MLVEVSKRLSHYLVLQVAPLLLLIICMSWSPFFEFLTSLYGARSSSPSQFLFHIPSDPRWRVVQLDILRKSPVYPNIL